MKCSPVSDVGLLDGCPLAQRDQGRADLALTLPPLTLSSAF